MELHDWIIYCTDLFDSSDLLMLSDKRHSYITVNKKSLAYAPFSTIYPNVFDAYGQDTFKFFLVNKLINEHKHYGLWNNNVGYIFRIDTEIPAAIRYFNDLWKMVSPTVVFNNIEKNHPQLLIDCSDCNYYNDMIVTGFCCSKMQGVQSKLYL